LRYEDFASFPVASTRQLLRLAGVDRQGPVEGDGTIELGENHTVSGNRHRFTRGRVEIRLDDAWTREMPSRDKALVAALTLPLLRRYRYPLVA
jgi:hypothetical protein